MCHPPGDAVFDWILVPAFAGINMRGNDGGAATLYN